MDNKDSILNKKLAIIVTALLAFLVVSIILLVTGAAQEFFMSIGLYTEGEKEITINYMEYVPKGNSDSVIFGDNILMADQTGVSCFSREGTWKWSKELNLTSPVLLQTEDKVIAVDVGGTGVHFFNKTGFIETYLTGGMIIGMSENTVNDRICILHRADSYISAATLLDFSSEVKPIATRKFGEYYMSAASFAPSGDKFTVSGIMQNEETYKTVAVTISVDSFEVLSTDENVADVWMPYMIYVKEDMICYGGGEKIVVDDDGDKTVIEGDFSSVLVCDGEIFTVCSENDKSYVRVYSFSGRLKDEFETKKDTDGIVIYKNTIVLSDENTAFFYNRHGHYLGKMDEISQLSDIEFTGRRKFFVCGGSKTAEVHIG